MKVLVTGGAGFIGSHLCEKLVSEGHEVVCLDNFNDFYDPQIKRQNIKSLLANKNFQLIEGDIIDEKIVQKVFKDHSFEQVFHIAARAGVRPSLIDPALYEKVNVQGTINLLQQSRLMKVKKFIFASSSSVYGNNKKVPFSESDNVDHPISPYAATKKAAELVCHTYAHLYNLPIACIRFFTVYGPRQRPEMGIALFTHKILNGEEISMFGDGSSSRDYTYIDDIIQGITSVMNLGDLKYEIINLGNSNPISLKDLLTLIEKETGKKAMIKQKPMQPGDVNITYADISYAKKRLNYEPTTQIEMGIKKYVSYVKK